MIITIKRSGIFLNQVCFVGRIVRHPEVKDLDENYCVLNNTLAISRPVRNQNGEEVTDFIPFVVWNRLAKIMEKYTSKGDQVGIAGRMQSRTYEDKNQKKVYVVECLVTDLTLLAGPVNRRLAEETQVNHQEEITAKDSQDIAQVLSSLKPNREETNHEKN